ncbi:MAG: redoxin domain-containing protein [Luteolibacter sp.]
MKTFVTSALVGIVSLAAAHAAEVGKAAPAFSAKDAKGSTVSLSDLKGKVVVLEWNNFGCPFVKKHYGSGNMQKLQETYTGKGVVWLTVNSSATGKEGFLDAAAALSKTSEEKWKGSHYLIDGDGKIGKAYGAKTTPHMFVIDKEGTLVYSGAIDSKATPKQDDIASSENYVAAAADAALAGKAVTTSKTEPYGCGVKY